jgi:dTDP-4-amino-4,6-dideoxygalactose transaminase
LSAQHSEIGAEVSEAVERVLRDGDFILGAEVERFETDFAAYCGATAAVGVDSGTSALELALRAFDCGPGDEVITVANSFIATALAITHVGAKPVFVDVDPGTFLMDVTQLEAAITPSTQAIIPVHLYGQVADMDPILALARDRGLAVIEDAAQAHGATYRGRRAGSLGDAAAFSFYPAKNLGAAGDAGMVVVADGARAERLRLLRNYGQAVKNRHDLLGFNRRLDTLQAAVLQVKLRHLDQWSEDRRERAVLYDELLAASSLRTPSPASEGEHVYHLYVVRADDRDGLRAELADKEISTQVHYPTPIHLQPAYAGLGLGPGSFPVTEQLAGEILSLPMYPELPLDFVEHVAREAGAVAAPRA